MLCNNLISVFEKDLDKLKQEISLYTNETDLWALQEGIANTGGNLCLHLCGNLQHYIGAVLGNTGYNRNRDLEFSAKGINKAALIDEIQKTKRSVLATLKTINPDSLIKDYPAPVFDYTMSTMHFFIHLQSHFNYHLGQINYHRRLLDK